MLDPLIVLTNPPFPVRLAGRTVRVAKLRPLDYGRLRAWIAARVPHPKLAAAAEMPAGLDGDARAEYWRAAVRASEAWPPTPESPEGAALLSTRAGRAFVLRTLIGRHVRGFTRRQAADLAAELGPGEFEGLLTLVWPGDRYQWAPAPPEGPSLGWGQAYCELMRRFPGLTVEAIGRLSFDAIHLLLRDGAPEIRRAVPIRDLSEAGLATARQAMRDDLLAELDEFRRVIGLDGDGADTAETDAAETDELPVDQEVK